MSGFYDSAYSKSSEKDDARDDGEEAGRSASRAKIAALRAENDARLDEMCKLRLAYSEVCAENERLKAAVAEHFHCSAKEILREPCPHKAQLAEALRLGDALADLDRHPPGPRGEDHCISCRWRKFRETVKP